MGLVCGLCGKVLKGNTAEALRAHQQQSESCRPRAGANESSTIKALDEKLARIIEEGRRIGTNGGSFEDSERNTRGDASQMLTRRRI
jgi:hypothetical protein